MKHLSERDQAILNVIFDPLQSFESNVTLESQICGDEETEVLDEHILNIVKDAISSAESKNFEKSFCLFKEALEKAPRSPSILNNRAQALRLAGRNHEALKDLDLAIEFSEGKGKAGILALCQRGVLYRSMNEDSKAKEDFTRASEAGSSFARSQLVALNPYAAMCNAMLREISLKS